MKILTESDWQREDRINSINTLEKIDRVLSRKYQTKMLNTPLGRSLSAQLDRGVEKPVARVFRSRHQEQEFFKRHSDQQQHTLGFSYVGAGITAPAAVTWLSQAWDNTAVYPAGNGVSPVPGSFIQYRGSVYAIPGTVASTAGTPPTGGVWVLQPQSPGGNAWNVNPNARMSNFANPTAFFPNPPVFTDVVDSYWYPPDAQVTSNNASDFYFPAPGLAFVVNASATTFPTLQVNVNSSFVTVFTFTATTFFFWMFDGLTTKIQSVANRQTYTIYRVRQVAQ